MAKKLTKIRAKFGVIFTLISFFFGTFALSFIFYKYLLVFIPNDWSWFENYPRRSETNDLRRVLSLILGIFTTISLLREYFD
ncbi:MAG: hypothetical protein ACXVB4_10420 [Pseudobdellovibrionaceae bacterium]